VFELKRNAAILLLAAVGTAGIAGCGGGDDDSDPAPTAVTGTTDVAITKDELIDQGDSFCSEVNAAVGTIDSSTTSDESVKQDQISSIYSGLAERLQDLGTPSDGEAPTAVIEAAQALAESTSTDGAAALETFQSAADSYGFTECGEAPAAPSSSSSSTGGSTETPSDSSGSGGYVAPTTPAPAEPAPAPAPADPPAGNGGGVVPQAPADPGTGGGSSSGGISPG